MDGIEVRYPAGARPGTLTDEDCGALPVESLSPTTPRRDRVATLSAFARRGVAHCRLVDPDARTREALAPAEGAYRLPELGR